MNLEWQKTLRKRDNLRNVKITALSPAENGILEDDWKNERKVKVKTFGRMKVKSQRDYYEQNHPWC